VREAWTRDSEQAFKQILGGCDSVVAGLGSRNKAGDAHGSRRRIYRPAPRHATLAVNLAGVSALFLSEARDQPNCCRRLLVLESLPPSARAVVPRDLRW
jgi:hypothetical protein